MGTPPPIEIANIGMADTLFIMVLALVFFGPRRLPQIGRQIGKLMYEFRKASNDFKFQMEEELRQSEEADRRKKEEAERQKALAANPPVPQLDAPAPPAASDVGSPTPTPEPPTSSLESPTASPYPGESTYPNQTAEPTRSDDATAEAVEAARLRIEPSIAPRIQPPSTGEVVAANRPGASAQQADLPTQQIDPPAAPPAAASPNAGPAADDNLSGVNQADQAEPTEPAAHHG
jgi:sec-independent protein translocase protein TatB